MDAIFTFAVGAAAGVLIGVVLLIVTAAGGRDRKFQQWNQPERPGDVADVPPEDLEPPRIRPEKTDVGPNRIISYT